MVKKLLKHELRAILRVLMWFMIAVALLSVLARVIFELRQSAGNSEGITLELSAITVTSFWNLSMIALMFAGTLVCLVRYFKSLFTGEGYMTFSLPVTPTKLLVAKFLSALIVTVACTLEIVLCVLLALPSGQVGELWSELADFAAQIGELYSGQPLFAVETVLLVIASIPSGIVYLFLVASVGQLFTKHRVGMTFLLYYGSAFLIGMLFSIVLVPVITFTQNLSLHLILWFFILVVAGFDVGGFFLIRYLLNRKLNLVV